MPKIHFRLSYTICFSGFRQHVPLYQLPGFLKGNDDDDAIPSTGMDFTLLPPLNSFQDLTDEDSGNDDIVNVNNFPPSQINVPSVVPLMFSDLIRAETPERVEDQPTTVKDQAAKYIKWFCKLMVHEILGL